MKDIYERLFMTTDYADHLDYEPRYTYAMKHIGDPSSVADIGCGRGMLLSMVRKALPGVHLLAMDLGRWHALKDVAHLQADITTPSGLAAIRALNVDLLLATDVLEHLPLAAVEPVVEAMSHTCRRAIVTTADHSDVVAGYELHLTRKPATWWHDLLASYFTIEAEQSEENRMFAFALTAGAAA